MKMVLLALQFSLWGAVFTGCANADELRDRLWAAVRAEEVAQVEQALESGADVNAVNEIGVSALWIAAGKKDSPVVPTLLKYGANVNLRDGIWYQTPLSLAIRSNSLETARLLIDAGAADLDDGVRAATSTRQKKMLQLLLDNGRVSQDALDGGLFMVQDDKSEIHELLVAAGAKPFPAAGEIDRGRWGVLAGTYENDNTGTLVVAIEEVGLVVKSMQGNQVLREVGKGIFAPIGLTEHQYEFELMEEKVSRVLFRRHTAETAYYPLSAIPKENLDADSAEGLAANFKGQPMNWPQFRGPNASGIGDGQNLPVFWDLASGKNVRWVSTVPGLGHSCPVVWGNRVFLTTATSEVKDPKIRVGNYGNVDSVDDDSKHVWQIVCHDLETGEAIWSRELHTGIPKIKRHIKGSQANCTIATDGKLVVACFGSEGLYCLDLQGNLLWSRDLSAIDSSFAIDQEYEWGFASSPLIHEGLVYVQFDLSHDSMIAAYSLANGDKVWETPRDEIPSWSSPIIWKNSIRTELVTNASQYARSYDPETGKELWRLAKKSEATIPTPVPYGDLLVVCSGNRPIQPIFVIRPGGSGELNSENGSHDNAAIAWSTLRGGPYMPTPIVYQDVLYVCSNAGVLTAYDLASGRTIYRQRIGGISYTASPVASDGRIYFFSEQGEVRVVKAGLEFQLLAVNELDDLCLASPAIATGKLVVRTQHALIYLEQGAKFKPSEPGDE